VGALCVVCTRERAHRSGGRSSPGDIQARVGSSAAAKKPSCVEDVPTAVGARTFSGNPEAVGSGRSRTPGAGGQPTKEGGWVLDTSLDTSRVQLCRERAQPGSTARMRAEAPGLEGHGLVGGGQREVASVEPVVVFVQSQRMILDGVCWETGQCGSRTVVLQY
jgi:hypothetical protein